MTSSVSSRSHRNWYDDSANLTIIQYDHKALDDPRPRVRFTPEELEDYVSKYVHYSQLAREQDAAMAHDRAAIPAAYARAMETMALEQTNKKPLELYTYADIDATLDDLARKCKRTPRSLEDRILLTTYAANYVLLMKEHVLRHPTRFDADALTVIRMAKERLASMLPTPPNWQGASLNETPKPDIELIPAQLRDSAQTVTYDQLQVWRADLPSLVGVAFINTSSDSPYEAEDSVFFVRDYVTTARGSCHFDVQFENSGEDIFPFSPGHLLELIQKAEYVRVEDAP
ncbi:hypothetical protein FPV67DRAFT_570655 [Lyophyllum atratum]|nr:hypothetical protein FPV67DRAFT_570655 [Lyophyllum atratum]